MKRILTFILALTMLISPQYFVNAAEKIEIIANETYNDAVTHTVPKSIATEGEGSVIYVSKLEQGKALYMRHRWVDTLMKVPVTVTEDVVWIDSAFMLPDFKAERNIIEIHNGDKSQPLVTVDKSGTVCDGQGAPVYKVTKNEWYRYSVELNLITGKYDIYVNGTKRAERAILATETTEISGAGFTALANEEEESEIYNKYFRVYKTNKLPAIDEIEEASYNYEEKKLRKAEVEQIEEKSIMYYQDDFEDIAVGGRPPELTATCGGQVTEQDETGNYYRYTWTKGVNVAGNYECTKIGLADIPESLVFEVDVRAGKKNTGDAYVFSLRDAPPSGNYNFSRIIRILPDGTVANYGGQPLGEANCRNKWVRVQVICDFVNKTHDYYIDGELVQKGLPFQVTATNRRMSMLRIHCDSTADNGTLDVDNIKIYSGKKLATGEQEVVSSVVEMPEKVEVWEHEISDAALNIDMSKFKAAPDYGSKSTEFLKDFSEGTSAFKDTIVVTADGPNIWIKDKKYVLPTKKVTWDDEEYFLAPAELLATLSGETATYSNGTVNIGSDFTAKIGEKSITVAGTAYETNAMVQDIDGTAYVPLKEYVVYKLKKYCDESYKGLAVIADKQLDLQRSALENPIKKILALLAFDLPSKASLREAYEKSPVNGEHPRMFTTKKGFEDILKRAETDEILKAYLDGMKKKADEYLTYTWTYNKTSGTGSYANCETLYIAWLMTGDNKYAQKAEELALLIANDAEWHEGPYHLATSANSMLMAVVYDLFYDYLSDDTKEILATAAIEKGIKAGIKAYNGQLSDWPLRRTNWNTVCNGGHMFAAATFLGEGYDDDACLELLEKSFYSLAYIMHIYSSGSCFEGIGYFGYGTENLVKATIALNSVFGTDFGISNFTGFLESGYFGFYTQTAIDKWAIHDDTLKSGFDNYLAAYFAYRTKDLDLQKMRYDQILAKGYTAHIYDVVYYMPEKMPEKINAPVDRNYSFTEIATSRSDWSKSAYFLGVHAGANNFEHGQQDLGNFIYEAFGLRFGHDIGRDSYNLPDYFNEGTTKLNIYVHRTEAHNLFVINPSEDSGQVWRAKSEIEVQEQKDRGIIYTVDLTPAYYNQLVEAKRGYMFTHDRSVLVVQDEIVPLEIDDEYKWFWNTEADIEICEDKKSAILTNNRKVVKLYFDANVEFEMEKGETVPLATSPNYPGQLLIGNMANKITITFYAEEEAMDKIYFRCTAIPYGREDYDKGEIKPISEWTIPDGDFFTNYSNADKIYANGKLLRNYSPEVYDYTEYYVKSQGLPTVTAEGNGTVTVRQAEDEYKTAVVTITSPSGVEKRYTITFQSDIGSGLPTGTQIPVKEVVAMDSDDNLPINVLDNDLNTRWSGKTTHLGWIQLDLGETKEIDALAMAVYRGNTRAAIFDVQVSTDGKNYTTVVKNGQTTGTSLDMEYVQFDPINARYIKIIGYGATTSVYNSFTELRVFRTN